MFNNMAQYNLSQAVERVRDAKNGKRVASTFIWIGGGILVFDAGMAALGMLMMVSASGATADASTSTGGCCLGLSLIIGVIGIVVLVSGIVKQTRASEDLAEASAALDKLNRMAIPQQ